MHGVQPRPKTMPSSGAPMSPVAGRQDGLMVRCRNENCPMKTSPITMTTTPRMRTTTSCQRTSHAPERAEGRPVGDEDDREPEDEEGDAGEQPATGRASSPGSLNPPT